jgi:hypothetical protein
VAEIHLSLSAIAVNASPGVISGKNSPNRKLSKPDLTALLLISYTELKSPIPNSSELEWNIVRRAEVDFRRTSAGVLMPNQEQLALLHEGVLPWNRWRKRNADTVVNLRRADLTNLNLRRANLNGANLVEAKLPFAATEK